MKVGIVADVHVGNHKLHGGPTVAGANRRAREVADALRRAVAAANEAGCKRFVIAGDLFDTSRPTPQIERLVQEALEGSPPTYVVAGNHDIESSDTGDNALGPLKALRQVVVVERPQVFELDHTALLLVPFQPGDARVWLPAAIESLCRSPGLLEDQKLLVTHVGIIDPSTPPFLHGAHDAVEAVALEEWCAKSKVGHFAAGNWHSTKTWDAGRIVQVGCLAPTGWDNPGLSGYGSLWIYDEGTDPRQRTFLQPTAPSMRRIEIAGPRFVGAMNRTDIESATRAQDAGHLVYVRWMVGPEVGAPSAAEAQSIIAEMVRDGRLTAGEAVDQSAVGAAATAREAAKSAAEGARAAGGAGLDEALAAFVASMPVPSDVIDPDQWRLRVAASARQFLAAG